MRPVEFRSSSNGGLAIWEVPQEGVSYAIGVDTASGIHGGDWSVAEVIRMGDCRQVAEWRGHFDPSEWGKRCALLGWYYNEAIMAIETHPSPHGLSAYEAASREGYVNLYQQEVYDAREFRMTTRKGWHRTPGSTVAFLNRIRTALLEGVIIRSALLVTELQAIKTEWANATVGRPQEKLTSGSEHDDTVMAYSLALQVRDKAWVEGKTEETSREVVDPAQIYWQHVRRGDHPAEAVTLWDGT